MTTLNKLTFWQQHITQWKNSNLSQSEYCKQHNLKSHSFSYHKCKQIEKIKAESVVLIKPSAFIKLPVPQVITYPKPLTLHLHGGLSLSGLASNNIDLVKQLVESLS